MSARSFVMSGSHFGKIGEVEAKHYGGVIQLFDIDEAFFVGAMYPDKACLALPVVNFSREIQEAMHKLQSKRNKGKRPSLEEATSPFSVAKKEGRPSLKTTPADLIDRAIAKKQRRPSLKNGADHSPRPPTPEQAEASKRANAVLQEFGYALYGQQVGPKKMPPPPPPTEAPKKSERPMLTRLGKKVVKQAIKDAKRSIESERPKLKEKEARPKLKATTAAKGPKITGKADPKAVPFLKKEVAARGPCKAIWSLVEKYPKMSKADVIATAAAAGINPGTAGVQFGRAKRGA